MEEKNITTENLAVMIKKGFDKTATKAEMKQEFIGVNRHFDWIEKRLDKIENLLLSKHERRIEQLEFSVQEIKDLLAVK